MVPLLFLLLFRSGGCGSQPASARPGHIPRSPFPIGLGVVLRDRASGADWRWWPSLRAGAGWGLCRHLTPVLGSALWASAPVEQA